jgi:pimeloyl-ACP methyl ester carboxylesterase
MPSLSPHPRTQSATVPERGGHQALAVELQPERVSRARAGRGPTMIVVASLLAGLLAALALVAGPFADGSEPQVTGALMLGFAAGWALLAVCSARFTQRPQRWAAVPAVAMGITGAGLITLAPGAGTVSALGWVWPPLLIALVTWMIVRARRRLLYPIFGVLAHSAIGGGYETLANATDQPAAHVAGSRLIDVGGGRRLYMRSVGSGGPTVILEPGLGESAREMARLIAPDVARTTTVVVYDRAGHGRSDAEPAAGADAARDLHVLLERAHVPGPYVLAGHSLGGMFALSFAHRYPAEVGGIVLLDSMHPRQHNAFGGMDPLLAVVPTLARTGLARLLFDRKDGDPTAQARQLVRDVEQMPAELDRAAKLTSFANKPLIVLSAGTGSRPGWAAQQDDLARLSTGSVHRTVPGATHASLIDDRIDATLSSRAIRDVVKAVQRGRG